MDIEQFVKPQVKRDASGDAGSTSGSQRQPKTQKVGRSGAASSASEGDAQETSPAQDQPAAASAAAAAAAATPAAPASEALPTDVKGLTEMVHQLKKERIVKLDLTAVVEFLSAHAKESLGRPGSALSIKHMEGFAGASHKATFEASNPAPAELQVKAVLDVLLDPDKVLASAAADKEALDAFKKFAADAKVTKEMCERSCAAYKWNGGTPLTWTQFDKLKLASSSTSMLMADGLTVEDPLTREEIQQLNTGVSIMTAQFVRMLLVDQRKKLQEMWSGYTDPKSGVFSVDAESTLGKDLAPLLLPITLDGVTYRHVAAAAWAMVSTDRAFASMPDLTKLSAVLAQSLTTSNGHIYPGTATSIGSMLKEINHNVVLQSHITGLLAAASTALQVQKYEVEVGGTMVNLLEHLTNCPDVISAELSEF
jgi:hypothetical protein